MRTSHSELERLALDQLEPQLVRRGYQLIRNPSRADLPSFVEGYIPDAIAIGRNPKIALEIKGRGGFDMERSLATIRKRFEGQDDWVFQVFYFNSLEPLVMKLPADTIDEQVKRVAGLARTDAQAAFVLAWSVLEASARESGLLDDRPGGANRIVSLLASEGYIGRSQVSDFLDLANLRNRIVHGQLDIEPSEADVERILTLVSIIRTSDEDNTPH
ncbi:hypothetical protein [Mesorhizobium sp. 1B3]|uniref:hypothetical protein n=1 Tax=Mesorhizobium sp. 1B3 TaxID=3243599 RepID=UPI003D974FB3